MSSIQLISSPNILLVIGRYTEIALEARKINSQPLTSEVCRRKTQPPLPKVETLAEARAQPALFHVLGFLIPIQCFNYNFWHHCTAPECGAKDRITRCHFSHLCREKLIAVTRSGVTAHNHATCLKVLQYVAVESRIFCYFSSNLHQFFLRHKLHEKVAQFNTILTYTVQIREHEHRTRIIIPMTQSILHQPHGTQEVSWIRAAPMR